MRARDRLAAALVLLVMGVACLALWIALPAAVLWVLSRATGSFTAHFVLGILLVPGAMAAFAPVLFWLNGLYLRIAGVQARLEADEREADWLRRVSGPLEPMLVCSLTIALAVFAIWFLFFAGPPLLRV